MPKTWGDYELVDESKLPARPDFTVLAREMTQPKPAPVGAEIARMAAPASQQRRAPALAPGQVSAGNIDLMHRPVVHNADGTISTVRSISIGTDQGEVLIPTVSDDGRILTDKQAIDLYRATAKNLGVFRDPDSATAYAQSLHQQQADLYGRPPAAPAPASDQRYRPGSLLGKVIASLSNAVPGGGLLSDETIKAADGYAGFDPSTPTGIPQAPPLQRGDYVDMGVRSIARVPDIAGNLIDLIPNAGDAAVRAVGMEPGITSALIRQGLKPISDAAHEPTRRANEIGYGIPSVDAGQALDAVDPRTEGSLGERLSTLARFVPETLVGSAGDMAGAVAAPVPYMAARTNEIATNRAANDNRRDVSATDLGVAAPAAAIETLLEKFTTSRLLPGGGAHAPAATLAEALSRVAKETGLQAASGGVEEVVPYLAETAGTQTGANARDAAAQAFGGALSEGALGAAVEAPREIASIPRPQRALGAELAQQAAEASPPAAPQQPAPASAAADASNFEVVELPPAAPVAPAQRPQVAKPVEKQEVQAAPAEQQQPAAAPAPARAPEAAPAANAATVSAPAAKQLDAAAAPPAATPASAEVTATPRPDMDAATKAIDTRLAALDESASTALPESKVSELNAERQQLDDLVREQDQTRRAGILQAPDARLTQDERAQADARRAEIAAELERHRAARSAADQAARLRQRLEGADGDAALYKIAQEIDPTLGTAQAQAYRSAPEDQQQAARSEPPRADVPAMPPDAIVPPPASPAPAPPAAQVQTAPTPSTDAPAPTPPPAAAAPAAPPPSRAPAQAAAPAPAPAAAAAPAAPERQTSLKNAVTDTERVAEGRDPIIAAARQGNRETVDAALQQVRANPRIGRETAARLARGGKASLQDEAVLLVHKVDLRKQRDAAAAIAQDTSASEEARAQARREYDDVVQQIDEVDQAAKRVGTESGRLLQLRRRMIAEDYTLPALERRLAMAVARPVTDTERAELRKMADRVADLERKLGDAERAAAKTQVADLLAKLMKSAPGRSATLADRRAAATESRAALLATTKPRASRGTGTPLSPADVRGELAAVLGADAVRKLESSGLLKITAGDGGRTQAEWDGQRITAFEGNIPKGHALPVLLHEVTHAKVEEVLGPEGFAKAQADFDALLAKGDPMARAADERVRQADVAQADVPHERLAYLVEEAARGKPSSGVVGLVQRVLAAFRRWAATSPVFKALERLGISAPTLRPQDFVVFARQQLQRMVVDAENPRTAEVMRLSDRVRELERQLTTNPITGLPNKAAFDADESLGWSTVAAFDMDGLKRLNDAVGHEAADEVLRALGAELRGAAGPDVRFYHRSGDEFAGRFRDPADAERIMADIQQALDGMELRLDVADDAGAVRSYTYQGIGISYGTGSNYEAADAAANRQKDARLAAGTRESPRADGPSRRLRESPARPGGRRAGDPPAEVAGTVRRSERAPEAPAGVDPVAFFHLVRMGAYHVADGARDVGEWTRRMEADLGAAADAYRDVLPTVFPAAQAQVGQTRGDVETVAEALQAIGDKRRPRDVKRVIRAIVNEGMRGEDAVIQEAGRSLGLDDDMVRQLFVQAEGRPQTETEARRELKDLRKLVAMQEQIDRLEAGTPKARASAGADSPAVAKRRAELEALREQLRAAARPDEETRYQDLRGRDLQRRIADLEERIRAGDFEKRPRTERALTAENQRLRYELESTRERFHRFAMEAEFNSRTPLGKLFGNTVAGVNFARAVMTSLDLSAVLRQGGFITLGRPGRAIRAFPGSLRAALSERADFEIRQEIESRPNAPLYRKFGLELTGIGGDALTRTEEAYASRWVDKIPSVLGGGLIRGSGRAYTSCLNRLRADSFDAMLGALARNGAAPTPEEGKAIANYINVATGRGRVGKNEAAGEVLNAVFFAPRLVASRFQLLAGQPLYGGSARTRTMIAQEYARFLIGTSVAIALAMMMRDDQDETKPIELDPRSSNFGKVRFGDTFVDPLVGLAQVTVFLARVASGETRTTTTDALRPLRSQYRLTDVVPGLGDGKPLGDVRYGGRDVPDVIAAFLRSKLAPVPGAVVNLTAGENMIGEPVTPLSAAGELITPMSVSNLVDVMESQGMARGTAINLLGLLGMSVQYRKSKEERAAEDANGVPGMLGVGRAPGAGGGDGE